MELKRGFVEREYLEMVLEDFFSKFHSGQA